MLHNHRNGLIVMQTGKCGVIIRRKTYKTRVEAHQDVSDYIEMFYNPTRKHVRNGMLSPVNFERQQKMTTEGV